MPNKSNPMSEQDDEKAPILGSWNRLYVLVMVLHFIVIALFYWLTMAYA
jgi:hypothetical protein